MHEDLFSVKGKVIVVTGGLGQLGRQFVGSLIDHGARVAVLDIQVNEKSVQELFPAYCCSSDILFIHADITDKHTLEVALEKIKSEWDIPHALVNNAGLDSPPGKSTKENGPFESYPVDSWDRIMDVNVKGVFLCCQVFGGQMANVGRGSIINICSIYGVVSPDQRIYKYRRTNEQSFFKPVAYSTSKSALLNLTRYLSTYWADKNVRVNTLTLGGVFNNQDKNFLKNYSEKVPLARLARENEYNGAIIFLISDASSYMTGSNLVIDGGWTAW